MACLVLVAIPLYMMELIIGQHTRLSTVPCFNLIRALHYVTTVIYIYEYSHAVVNAL